MSNVLQPCPFCGSSKVGMQREFDYEAASVCTWCFIECRDCRASSGKKWFSEGNDCPLFYEEVRSKWNDRKRIFKGNLSGE